MACEMSKQRMSRLQLQAEIEGKGKGKGFFGRYQDAFEIVYALSSEFKSRYFELGNLATAYLLTNTPKVKSGWLAKVPPPQTQARRLVFTDLSHLLFHLKIHFSHHLPQTARGNSQQHEPACSIRTRSNSSNDLTVSAIVGIISPLFAFRTQRSDRIFNHSVQETTQTLPQSRLLY